ncbi:MAG: translation initiation factor IF-2 [Deltaproteobacteria bacterium]|nr:translation initiation factor IF-2 [Deltaproteobacteria bacterium]
MENKQGVVEKRIKPGVIRRRAKATEPEAPPPAESAPEASVAEAPAAPAVPEAAAPPPASAEPPAVEAKAPEAPAAVKPAARAPEPAAPEAKKPAPAKPVQTVIRAKEDEPKVVGPRALPEGPPVGTIIQLPHMKRKAEGPAFGPGAGVAPATSAEGPEDEESKKLRGKKGGGKKTKLEEDELGIDGIGRVSTLSQIARISTHNTADRVFQPVRSGKRRRTKSRVPGKKTESTLPKAIKRVVKMGENISVSDLAQQLGVKGGELIKKLMAMGTMATLNQALDFDTATLLAQDYQWEVRKTSFEEENVLKTEEDKPEALVIRAPVVTVMGHVDHGKTSLLDAIRSTQVASGEHGGITQHIGAYRVRLGQGRELTFLDTPGHEAFTSMRARGASVTDIVVLVVAADDGVMPQTLEAIHHAKAAEVPIIVAVNKVDKPDAKPDNVKRQLSEHGLLAEDWGGDILFVHVSAKTKQGIEQLLESIFLQTEMLELKANPAKLAKGVIIEARLEKGRGPVVTALIQEGTLHAGDVVVAGQHFGKVRAMTNDRGESVTEAGPGVPVEVLGLDGVPQASDVIQALADEKSAKQVAEHRQMKAREQKITAPTKMSLEDLFTKLKSGEAKELSLILKADVQGSSEALQASLEKLSTPQVRVNVLHSGVGGITESDVMLASASNAVIIGFHVRPDTKARELAEQEGVEVQVYQIIYDAVEDVKKAMEGLLEPTRKEKYLGRAEVREVFNISKVGNVAGCYVIDGKLQRNANVRLLRDSVILHEGKLSSLKRFKDDAREVEKGYECGLGIEGYNDIKAGDVIECYQIEVTKTKLSQ